MRRPYLQVANVQRGYLDLDEIKEIGLTDEEFQLAVLHKGDLLVVEGNGNPNKLGRSAMWDGSVNGCVHQNHLIRIRCNASMITPDYLLAFLNSPVGRYYFFGSGNTNSGLVTISTSIMKKCTIPVLPRAIQREFAARAREEKQAQSAGRLEALFESLLARAFAGAL